MKVSCIGDDKSGLLPSLLSFSCFLYWSVVMEMTSSGAHNSKQRAAKVVVNAAKVDIICVKVMKSLKII